MSLSHYVWLPYIFMPHTGHRARARPPARAHTPRAHTRTPVSTQTHTPREWTQDSAQCRRRIYMRVSPRGHGNLQLFRVLPLWGTIYPSDMKVGNLLPACDWNMSSFLYRYNFRFWSFLLRSHWCAGALAAAPLWALGGVTAPSGRRPCVLEGAEKAPFGMRRDGVLNTLYTNIPFDAESST